jgi:hypothetical protein
MKKILIRTLALALLICLVFSFSACTEEEEGIATLPETGVTQEDSPSAGVWKNALYQENKELGEGETTFAFEVELAGSVLTFTIHTNKANLGEILLEENLIEGEDSAYGLYVKKVNGITADYDVDASYWSLTVNGESSMTGVSGVTVENGGTYRFVYTK